ncbi:MAG: hypothetical protein JWP01_96 [Myxococcales bacterium]|nr:hypothetical protein [Myxococcales bacterium]
MTRLLRLSAVLTIVALALMVWSMLAPTPMPVMVAMTVGQGLGTLAFALYLFVIVRDLREHWRADRVEQITVDIPALAEGPRIDDGPPS